MKKKSSKSIYTITFYLIFCSFIIITSAYAECIYSKPLDQLTPMYPDICGFCKTGCGGYTVPHKGIDFEADKDDKVYAVCDGKVETDAIKENDVYNSYLIIKHQSAQGDFYAFYAHISSSLKAGDIVKKGEEIGSIKEWINENGIADPQNTHLHFGIKLSYLSPGEFFGYPVTEQSCEELKSMGWRDPIEFLGLGDVPLLVSDFYLKNTKIIEGELFDAQAKIYNNSDENYQIDGYALEIHQANNLHCRLELHDSPATIAPCSYLQLAGDNMGDCNEKFTAGTYDVVVSIKRQGEWAPIADQELIIGDLPFSDVDKDHSNYTAISELYAMGVIQGYENGEFRPQIPINRAEFLKILILTAHETPGLVLGKKEDRNYNGFSDVVISEWYGKYVIEAYEAGIIDGYPDGSFKPDEKINRAEAAKMVIETFGFIEDHENISQIAENARNKFNDLIKTGWFDKYVGKIIQKQLMAEWLSKNEFSPHVTVTRGEMSEFIYSSYQKYE